MARVIGGSSPSRPAMLVIANCFLMFILFMTLGAIWGMGTSPTRLWIGVYSAYYGLLIYGSHYYSGKLALKMFGRYKPDESKPGLLNYWLAKLVLFIYRQYPNL